MDKDLFMCEHDIDWTIFMCWSNAEPIEPTEVKNVWKKFVHKKLWWIWINKDNNDYLVYAQNCRVTGWNNRIINWLSEGQLLALGFEEVIEDWVRM